MFRLVDSILARAILRVLRISVNATGSNILTINTIAPVDDDFRQFPGLSSVGDTSSV